MIDQKDELEGAPPQKNVKASAVTKFKERFGIVGSIFLILGTLIIIAISGMWVWMWVFCNSPNMTTQTGTWTNLILSGWQTRFITISTAVVRFCVTTQLVALCLILATLALEHGSVQGEDADRMSILQHDTSGPTDIASSYLTKLKSGKISIGMITVFVLVAESTLVQFASTFLISDFKMYNLDSQLQNRTINYTQDYDFQGDHFDNADVMVASGQFQYPIFAEMPIQDATFISDGPTSPGLADSGNVTRAFVPLGSQAERMTLSSYRGPAKSITTQYVCFAPEIAYRSEVNIENLYNNDTWHIKKATFNATIDLKPGSPNHKMLERSSLPIGDTSMPHGFVLDYTNAVIMPRIVDGINDDKIYTISTALLSVFPPAINKHYLSAQFILVTNSTWEETNPVTVRSTVTYDGSEWTTRTFPTVQAPAKLANSPVRNINISVRQSLCVSIFNTGTADIVIDAPQRPHNFTEPAVTRDISTHDWQYVTADLQKQLGVLGPKRGSDDERGILPISTIHPNSDVYWDMVGLGTAFRSYGDNTPTITDHHGPNYAGAKTTLNPILEALFFNTIESTGNMALAWEAISTGIIKAHFYESLDLGLFSQPGNSTLGFYKPYSLPRQYIGLAIMISTLAVHLALVMLIVAAFVASRSFRDNVRYIGHDGPPIGGSTGNYVVAGRTRYRAVAGRSDD